MTLLCLAHKCHKKTISRLVLELVLFNKRSNMEITLTISCSSIWAKVSILANKVTE